MKPWSKTLMAGLLLIFALPGPGVAQAVTWETRELVLEAEPGGAQVEGVFTFTNQSESDVTITSVKTSCGCTTAKLEKTTYGPGESGQIAVAFAVGDRTGDQVKKVVVRTDAPESPVTTLTLKVGIPQLVEITPRLLKWTAEEDREAKVIDVVLHETHPVVIKGVESGDAEMEVELEEVEEGLHYRVKVVPTGEAALRAVVTLVTERGETEDEKNPLRFLVRAAQRTAAADKPLVSGGEATEGLPNKAESSDHEQAAAAD